MAHPTTGYSPTTENPSHYLKMSAGGGTFRMELTRSPWNTPRCTPSAGVSNWNLAKGEPPAAATLASRVTCYRLREAGPRMKLLMHQPGLYGPRRHQYCCDSSGTRHP